MVKTAFSLFESTEVDDQVAVHTFVDLVFVLDIVLLVAAARQKDCEGASLGSLVLTVMRREDLTVLHQLGSLELQVVSVSAAVVFVDQFNFHTLLRLGYISWNVPVERS